MGNSTSKPNSSENARLGMNNPPESDRETGPERLGIIALRVLEDIQNGTNVRAQQCTTDKEVTDHK